MSIPTNKNIKAVSYNGTNIPLSVPTETKTVALSMASGNQVVNATSGKYMTAVTVTKPSTLVPGNIKSGVSIGGVTGSLVVPTVQTGKTYSATANGSYTISPGSGYDAMSSVTLTVAVPTYDGSVT